MTVTDTAVDHVIDAIDNALAWELGMPDAMAVRYNTRTRITDTQAAARVFNEIGERLNEAMIPAVKQMRLSFERAGQCAQECLRAWSTVMDRLPAPAQEVGARERALEARRHRNTGPVRNPHRHRGL